MNGPPKSRTMTSNLLTGSGSLHPSGVPVAWAGAASRTAEPRTPSDVMAVTPRSAWRARVGSGVVFTSERIPVPRFDHCHQTRSLPHMLGLNEYPECNPDQAVSCRVVWKLT